MHPGNVHKALLGCVFGWTTSFLSLETSCALFLLLIIWNQWQLRNERRGGVWCIVCAIIGGVSSSCVHPYASGRWVCLPFKPFSLPFMFHFVDNFDFFCYKAFWAEGDTNNVIKCSNERKLASRQWALESRQIITNRTHKLLTIRQSCIQYSSAPTKLALLLSNPLHQKLYLIMFAPPVSLVPQEIVLPYCYSTGRALISSSMSSLVFV